MSVPTYNQAIAEFYGEIDSAIWSKDYKRLIELADILSEVDYEEACQLKEKALELKAEATF